MDDDTLGSPQRNLPVWTIVKGSYSYIGKYWRLFALPLCELIVAGIALGALSRWALPRMIPETLPPIIVMLIELSSKVPMAIVTCAFMVGLHRTILLGEHRQGVAFFRLDRSLLRYLATAALIVLSCSVVAAIVFALTGVIMYVFGLNQVGYVFLLSAALVGMALVLSVRLALALPAAAVAEHKVLVLSWHVTRGNWLRLIAVCVLAALPFLLHNFSEPWWWLNIARVALLITVVAVALTLSYEVLMRSGRSAT